MKLMQSTPKQALGLFGYVGLGAGLCLNCPVAQFIFESPKGPACISDWVIPVFAFTCTLAGISIPYGVFSQPYLNAKGWKYLSIVALLSLATFISLAIAGSFLYGKIYSTILDVPRWVANLVFLMIPVFTLLVPLTIGFLTKLIARRQSMVDSHQLCQTSMEC
jgi:hypothetical protein